MAEPENQGLAPTYHWAMTATGLWNLIDINDPEMTPLSYEHEVWRAEQGGWPAPEPPAGRLYDDPQNPQDDIAPDDPRLEGGGDDGGGDDGGDGGIIGGARRVAQRYAQNPTSPFANLAPWAAWNALPNMISQLEGTMDYWLTKNQRQMLEKSKLWTALRMMGMITGHDYDPETGEYRMPGEGDYEDETARERRRRRREERRGQGLGPSSVLNIQSSPTSPTFASYGDGGIEVSTPQYGSFPQMAQSAFGQLRSGIGGTGPLNDIMSQGLMTAGNQARTGVVEPALMAGQADTQAARDAQTAQQTISGGQFAAGLGARQEDLGLAAYETDMRKQLGLVGPMMQYMNPLQQSLMG